MFVECTVIQISIYSQPCFKEHLYIQKLPVVPFVLFEFLYSSHLLWMTLCVSRPRACSIYWHFLVFFHSLNAVELTGMKTPRRHGHHIKRKASGIITKKIVSKPLSICLRMNIALWLLGIRRNARARATNYVLWRHHSNLCGIYTWSRCHLISVCCVISVIDRHS